MAIREIKKCINKNESFYLVAAAGSGKTYTLIETLKYILEKSKKKSIACITYTNVAKREIIERSNFDKKLEVYTIHEFFWQIIKNYQKELKNLIKEKLKDPKEITVLEEVNKIEYKEYRKYSKGKISHDDILAFTEKLFEKYGDKLSKIVASKYKYIFVDEYQDTSDKILKVLIEKIKTSGCLIGLFGDPVQKIYPGNIYKLEERDLKKIKKNENYRSCIKIVELLNKLRDDIEQIPIRKEEGKIKVYYNPKDELDFYVNDFSDLSKEKIKQLYLVHKRMAKNYEYLEFYEIIANGRTKDCFIANEKNRDNTIANSLYFLEKCSVQAKKDQAFQLLRNLEKLDYKLENSEDRKKLKEYFKELIDIKKTGTFKEVFEFMKSKDGPIKMFEIDEREKELYNKILEIKYSQFSELYEIYNKEYSDIRTKHSTKGEEYDNVIINICEKSDWNNYDFEKYFIGETTPLCYERTKNIFYVACSRAKNNLILNITTELSDGARCKIKNLFGFDNYREI
ncbi:MAG: UvrD-helicase domain-containing protein [Fusobacteriaceae bacterium]